MYRLVQVIKCLNENFDLIDFIEMIPCYLAHPTNFWFHSIYYDTKWIIIIDWDIGDGL